MIEQENGHHFSFLFVKLDSIFFVKQNKISYAMWYQQG